MKKYFPQILSPRTDIGIYNGGRCKKKRLKDGDKKEGDGITGEEDDDDSRASGVVSHKLYISMGKKHHIVWSVIRLILKLSIKFED